MKVYCQLHVSPFVRTRFCVTRPLCECMCVCVCVCVCDCLFSLCYHTFISPVIRLSTHIRPQSDTKINKWRLTSTTPHIFKTRTESTLILPLTISQFISPVNETLRLYYENKFVNVLVFKLSPCSKLQILLILFKEWIHIFLPTVITKQSRYFANKLHHSLLLKRVVCTVSTGI